jgi:hypothetical protein
MRLVYALIPIVISCAAFAFSVFTWRERKAQDQRDLFLRIHERLVDVDLQRGRRVLFQMVQSIEDARALFQDRREDSDLANRALAMLDMAALYVERGYIDRDLFVQEWGFAYASILENARYFIAERASRAVRPTVRSWPHFQLLASQATEDAWLNDNTGTELLNLLILRVFQACLQLADMCVDLVECCSPVHSRRQC